MKYKKNLGWVSCIWILCLLLIGCQNKTRNVEPLSLLVSAPISYQKVLLELGKIYQQENPNLNLTYNFGYASLLKEQVEKSLPVDILISIDPQTLKELESLNFTIPGTRQTLPIKNYLVLIVPQGIKSRIYQFEDLTDPQVKKVALGSDRLFSGNQTKKILTYLGIYDRVKSKAIFAGENFSQVIRVVETKQADAGITYLTEAKLSNQVKIVAIAPEEASSDITYSAVVIKGCKNVPKAEEFIEFLASKKAKEIAKKYGFTVIK